MIHIIHCSHILKLELHVMKNWTAQYLKCYMFINKKTISFVMHEFTKYNRNSGTILSGCVINMFETMRQTYEYVNTFTSYCYHVLTLQCYCEMMSQYHSPHTTMCIFYFHVRSKKQLARESHSNNNQETLNSGGSRMYSFFGSGRQSLEGGQPYICQKISKVPTKFNEIHEIEVRTGKPLGSATV